MAVIDATNNVLGRLASVVAKRAMLGEKIEIVNCEKALVSGSKLYTLKLYVDNVHRGATLKGPYFPKQPEKVVKRTIRGMVPYRTAHGEKAMNRIFCYAGTPEKLQGKEAEKIARADVKGTNISKYVRLAEVSKQLGA